MADVIYDAVLVGGCPSNRILSDVPRVVDIIDSRFGTISMVSC